MALADAFEVDAVFHADAVFPEQGSQIDVLIRIKQGNGHVVPRRRRLEHLQSRQKGLVVLGDEIPRIGQEGRVGQYDGNHGRRRRRQVHLAAEGFQNISHSLGNGDVAGPQGP